MRIFSKILLMFCVLNPLLFAQQKQYFDAPFGGGGGFTPGWIFPKMDDVNIKLKHIGVPEFSGKGFFTSGGSGFIYLGFVPNFRIGGMGFGGSTSSSVTEQQQYIIDKSADKKSSQLIININKEVDYSIGGGGLTLEYTLPFVKNIGVSIGAIIGGGSLGIEIYKNTGSFNWENIWNEVNYQFTSENNRTIKNNFWFFTPTLNVDIPIYRFAAVRVGGGYQLTFANNWTVDNDQEISNIPSNLNGNSFFIQTGIFIGFFSF